MLSTEVAEPRSSSLDPPAHRLVDAGLDLEARDCLDCSPLISAIHEGSLEGVQALISVGANVNATHNRGFTVFMSAVGSSARRLDVMNALLKAGASPTALSNLGWNAFHTAIDVNGAEANSEQSIRETFGLLRDLGVDIDRKDHSGTTPLGRAAFAGSELEVRVLRELGAT
jgi:ankyrin repeat protein